MILIKTSIKRILMTTPMKLLILKKTKLSSITLQQHQSEIEKLKKFYNEKIDQMKEIYEEESKKRKKITEQNEKSERTINEIPNKIVKTNNSIRKSKELDIKKFLEEHGFSFIFNQSVRN